jgi:cysteine desulfurase/selenocysteine lyase
MGVIKVENRFPIFAFNLSLDLHPHDVSEILNRSKICVRAGHHCAHVLTASS